MSGYEAADFLRKKYNIEVESASGNNAVCLASIYNSRKEIHKLFHALAALSKNVTKKKIVIDEIMTDTDSGDMDLRLTPEKAFNASSDFVPADMSLDRINKRIIYRMPDEIPIILPGEKIKNRQLMEITRILKSDGTVKGLAPDNRIEVVGITDSFGI